MLKWTNFLQGNILLEATGTFPERFLNLCAQERVQFWAVQWPDGQTLRLRAVRRQEGKIKKLARRAQCQLTVVERAGLPPLLWKLRRRYALLLGLALSLCAVGVLSQFILTVEVEGNEAVSSQEILSVMKALGVRPGAYAPGIEENIVCAQALLELPELSWISVNIQGVRAQVEVRERTTRPEIEDTSTPANVVADVSGIITRMEVLSGQAMFQVGDTVAEGEVIVSGVIQLEGPAYSEIDLGTLTVHAAATVYARTWRTLTAEAPLQSGEKSYTGRATSRWSLNFFSLRVQFYKNSGISYVMYDKIKETYPLTLGIGLPVSLTRETLREYAAAETDTNADAAELEQRLLQRLERILEGREGEILEVSFSETRRDGLLTVTLTAQCSEKIGITQTFEGKLGHSLDNEGQEDPDG
ncbi:MAG: sporulation protein YqfD [Oscillospiraceae bacterium]|nr:sporulation protein YqfD [Oscillospiraceae bacterium]